LSDEFPLKNWGKALDYYLFYMESLISTFHLDAGLFIAQLVNFALVFSVLYFLVFKPLIKVMGERTDKIDKSLKEADEIEKRLADTAKEKEEILAAAKQQADEMLVQADKQAENRRQELVAKAKEEIGQVINAEKEKLEREKAITLKEMKQEIAGLVIMTVERVLGEKMTSDKDVELIKKMVK